MLFTCFLQSKILNKLFLEYHNIILLPDYEFGVIDEAD